MKNNEPVSDFLDGMEDNLRDEEETPLVMYGPEWIRSRHDAGEPPDGLDDPIWSEKTGWDPTGNYILCRYAEE